MGPIELNKRRIFLVLAGIAAFLIISNALTASGDDGRLAHIPTPGRPDHDPVISDTDSSWDFPASPAPDPSKQENVEQPPVKTDLHPINRLMHEADDKWRTYEGSRSTTFRQTLEKYRSKHGRHPPPGFKEWYQYARKKNIYNIDDFEQVMDDLRPFWTIEPAALRTYAAHMWEKTEDGISGLHIRNKKIAKLNNANWRAETMAEIIQPFVKYLPDMDIALNRLDQPRVVVPWEDMQEMLKKESESRVMPPETVDSFTTNATRLLDLRIEDPKEDKSERLDAHWFGAAGKQYMLIASKACPPGSPARTNYTDVEANALYKEKEGGFVNNFNLSSDLCTVGPTIQRLHGMLYSASSISASHSLVPVFGECKVNINNDILFPANMYYKHDARYDYKPDEDVDWREKHDNVLWRGVTSGGVQLVDTWQTMHRQRLVQLFNGTWVWKAAKEVNVLMEDRENSAEGQVTYKNYDHFQPSAFADQHSDIGFVEAWGCIPNCSFYDTVFSYKPQTTLTAQFRSRFLIDVDGHSFSGRWRAFLQSKSLGLKATIFREWHDSRLFAWRHFVPIDNRYDDMYAVLTYFIGYGKPNPEHAAESEDLNPQVYITPHEKEAQQLARQGREWANQVLRRDDMEIYMYRLLLEYARLLDDNRDRIGYSGDGSELDNFDNGQVASHGWGIPKWFGSDKAGKPATPPR